MTSWISVVWYDFQSYFRIFMLSVSIVPCWIISTHSSNTGITIGTKTIPNTYNTHMLILNNIPLMAVHQVKFHISFMLIHWDKTKMLGTYTEQKVIWRNWSCVQQIFVRLICIVLWKLKLDFVKPVLWFYLMCAPRLSSKYSRPMTYA